MLAFDSRAKSVRLITTISTIIVCVLITLFANVFLSTDLVYTHLFYIPIILSAIWFDYKAIWVALGLGLLHLYASLSISATGLYGPIVRIFMFLAVAAVIASLTRKLKTMYKKLKTITNSMLDVVCQIDQDGYYEYVSVSVADVLGYEKNELLGRSFFELIHEEDRAAMKNLFEKASSECGSFRSDYRYLQGQGHYIWIESVANPVEGIRKGETAYIIVSRDISERKAAEESLQYLSLHDPLTGVYNRKFFQEEMLRLNSGRFDPVGLIVCDIDNLKTINDSFGHSIGDQAIQAVSGLLERNVRASDIVARIGGDEFVILLFQASPSCIEKLYEKIRAASCSIVLESQNLEVTFSLGYSLRNGESTSLENYLKKADDMMYANKRKRLENIITNQLANSHENRDSKPPE